MDLDFKLEKVIALFDLIKGLSWGAIPLWLSVTIPILYLTYSKSLFNSTDLSSQHTWYSIPTLSKIVGYLSLLLFVLGTITLMLDQKQKERIRNNGLRMKQYLVSKNLYSVAKADFIEGKFKLFNFDADDLDNVLRQYPNEFLEIDQNTILLTDSLTLHRIVITSEKLLDNYLSNRDSLKNQRIDKLIEYSIFFTNGVTLKLIVDSSKKYVYAVNDGWPVISKSK